MTTHIKRSILILVAFVIASVPYLHSGKCTSCKAPALALGSIMGCSEEAKENKNVSTVANRKNADHKVTFVEIGSVNCIPCKMMQPIIKEIETEYAGQVQVLFHDVWTDQGKQDAMKYGGVRVIPTQIFLDKNGIEYFRHEGFFPKEELVIILKRQGVE